MKRLASELRLILRSRPLAAALLLLLLLSSAAVWSGLHETARQRATIARAIALNEQEVASVARRFAASLEGGNPANYTFYPTWDPPSGMAFLAIGLRDVAPYVLRIRATGLQAQLHEGERFNPELALAGRFDYAFVLVYLAPLFVIAFLHDLVSGERQAGRLRLLLAMPGSAGLWRTRVALRCALLYACLMAPVCIGAVLAGMPLGAFVLVLALTAGCLAFWSGLSLLVAARGWRSVANATALMGAWAGLMLVLPALAQVAIVRTVPVQQGVDLMVAQRQAVQGGWDLPRDATMRSFLAAYPAWRHTAPLPPRFHWKWLFAFNELGDRSVAPQVRAYREGLLARQAWSDRLGWLLPGVGIQAALHRAAGTDLPAQLAYQDRIAAFHRQIRLFYYGYLFEERTFGPADYARRPVYVPAAAVTRVDWTGIAAMACLAGLLAALGLRRLARITQ